MSIRTRSLATLASGVLVVSTAQVLVAAPAQAACDWVTYYETSIKTTGRIATVKSPSEYNRTKDPVTRTMTATNTKTRTNTASWEVGAEASFPIKVIEAKVSAKYGRSSTEAVQRSTSTSVSFKIRPRHSGWRQLNIFKRAYVVKKKRVAAHCGTQLMARAVYRDSYWNGSSHTREGRVPW
jgi:hypothetical protein